MKKKILIVEDESLIAYNLKLILTKAGYLVCGLADSVKEAEQIIEKESPDLVILDIFLKGTLTGIDLAREIRRRHLGLPVVLTSGYSQALSQNGSDGFDLLQKPYSIEQLSRVLHKVGRWRRLKRGAAE